MARYFTSDLIIPVDQPSMRNGIIETDDDGTILRIYEGTPPQNAEHFKGIIIPGFINAHCHLELSHLRGLIPEKRGMSAFIRSLMSQRFLVSDAEQLAAMKKAEKEMIDSGIVAIGDISNFALSAEIKKISKIYYHTFVEVIGLKSSRAKEIIDNGNNLSLAFLLDRKNNASVIPHAPFSVSDELFALLNKNYSKQDPVTIHMEESRDEYEFCISSGGPFADLFTELKIDYSEFKPGSGTPLEQTFPKINVKNKLQLVHNTYTEKEEIEWTESQHKNLYWCLCPNANLYINDRLPDLSLFNDENRKVTLGTDSLASNHQLSILDELKTISAAASFIPFERLIKWSTLSGAEFLGIDNKFGSIKTGKNPGLILIENINPENPELIAKSKSRRLI